ASVGSVAFFILPLVDLAPFLGQWPKLAAWPALAALGLGSAAVALAGTLALVRWLGLRRARVVAQLAGAFIGAALVILIQLPQLLPRGARDSLLMRADAQGWLGAQSALLWPLRAFLGEPWPLAIFVAGAVAAFAWAVKGTQHTFLQAMQDAPQALGASPRAVLRERPFRSGLARVVVMKELTLVARDPALIAKTLLQLLYLVPLFLITFRRAQPAELLAAALVVLASSLAGTLAWITVSGEEAPDLIASAPVSLERVRWLKVGSALVPLTVVVAPFLAGFAFDSLRLAAIAALFVALALASSAVVQVWATPLGAGRDVRQRYRQNPFVGIVDMLSSFAWAAACYLALLPTRWWLAAVAFGLLAPVAAWWSGRRARA
ncbi:MAG TPA: hypothetical protein VFP36_09245, partial [Usitatibacter sp.]|nr:hypothetical protein [Usitatibacter sp.]